MDLGVAPAHHLDRFHILADKIAGNLDTVTTQVDNGAAAGHLLVPEPVAMGTGVGFTGARPQHFANRAIFDGGNRFQRLGGVDQVFEIAMKDAGFLDHFQHPFGLGGIAPQRLGAENGFPRLTAEAHRFFVLDVRQANHHHIAIGVVDCFGQTRCVVGDAMLLGKGAGPLRPPRIDRNDPVAATLAVKR